MDTSWHLAAWKDVSGKLHGEYYLAQNLELLEKRGFIEIYQHSSISDGLSIELDKNTVVFKGRGEMEGLIIFRTPEGPLRFAGKVSFPKAPSRFQNLVPSGREPTAASATDWQFKATVTENLRNSMPGFQGSVQFPGSGPYLIEQYPDGAQSVGRPTEGTWTVGESTTLENPNAQTLHFEKTRVGGSGGC